MSYLEAKNLLHLRQHGFNSRRSCDQGKEVGAIMLDFSKAFDKVSHRKLIQKINSVGVNLQITEWVRSFLMGAPRRL